MKIIIIIIIMTIIIIIRENLERCTSHNKLGLSPIQSDRDLYKGSVFSQVSIKFFLNVFTEFSKYND